MSNERKTNEGPWNNSSKMADRESLNHANVSPGRGLALNHHSVAQICQRRLFRAIGFQRRWKAAQTRS